MTQPTLADGRIRYYDPERKANTVGKVRGNSFVTEYNPNTGQTRQWMESRDYNGNVTMIHPKSINGQSVSSQHYPPTKKRTGIMEKITQFEAFLALRKLLKQNLPKEHIADLAFDFYNRWDDSNSQESYDAIYDLALLGEPGMELSYDKIELLINELYDIDVVVNSKSADITTDFKTFSKFFLKLVPDVYTDLKVREIYHKLEEIYFQALVDCEIEMDNWEKYREKSLDLIKKLFLLNPYFLYKTGKSA